MYIAACVVNWPILVRPAIALPGRRYFQSWLRIPVYRRENKEPEPSQIKINYRVNKKASEFAVQNAFRAKRNEWEISNNLMIIYAQDFANVFTITCSSFKS